MVPWTCTTEGGGAVRSILGPFSADLWPPRSPQVQIDDCLMAVNQQRVPKAMAPRLSVVCRWGAELKDLSAAAGEVVRGLETSVWGA